jgi:hypothetical protein
MGGAPLHIDFSELDKAVDPMYANKKKVITSKPVYQKDWFRELNKNKRDRVFEAEGDPSLKDNRAKSIARDRFEDPYDDDYKDRLTNAALFDQVIQQTILTRIQYVLSNEFHVAFKPKRNVDHLSAQEAQAILDKVVPPVTQDKANNYIWQLENDIIPFRKNLESGLFTAFVGGRSALLMEPMIKNNPFRTTDNLAFPEGTPGALKILNYQHLGQVFVNPDSWVVEGIEYKDNIFEEENFSFEMPRNWLIYFTHMDVNMIPYSMNYGNSLLPPIMALSENNRRINEIVFPEINESLWAGTGHWKVNDMAIFDQQAFVDSIEPARYIVYQSSDMAFEEVHLSYDQRGLIDQRNENTILIMMQGRVPSMFLNKENITNRSTVEITAEVWQETVLEHDRRWLRDTLQHDWYNPLLELITGESRFTMKMTAMMEFQKKSFADFQAKAVALAALLALPNNPMDESEARQILGLPPQRVAILAQAGINKEHAQDLFEKQIEKEEEIFNKVNKNVDTEPSMKDIPIANFLLSRRVQRSKEKPE